jgi:hypothetical protein
VNRALAQEVGDRWVRRYSVSLTTRTLDHTLADLRADPPEGRPDLSARDWSTVGAAHVTAYRRALGPASARDGATTATQPRRYSW